MIHPIFSQILKKRAAAITLLGISFTAPTWAMDIETTQSSRNIHVSKIASYADLASQTALSVPPPKEGDLVLLNISHGLVKSCTSVSERNTEKSLYEKHIKFMTAIKALCETAYTTVTKKFKLGSGNELVKAGEKELPTTLKTLSANGINILPFTSRYDDGKCGTQTEEEVLSRTEMEFVSIYRTKMESVSIDDWKNWKKPIPFQDLTREVMLQDNNPGDHSAYRLRNGIIYHYGSSLTPHKSAAITGLINILKEENHLPAAIYMTDGAKTIHEIVEDFQNVNFEIPLFLLEYKQPKAFSTPEDIKEFYIHRLGEKFQNYESKFNEIFNQ